MKTLIFFLLIGTLFAQDRYIVQFKDKGSYTTNQFTADDLFAPRGIERRKKHNLSIQQKDLPVYAAYGSQIYPKVKNVLLWSKWWNGCLVEASQDQIKSIESLPFVLKAQKVANGLTPQREYIDFGSGFEQAHFLGITAMQQNGFTGKSVLVGVIDAGFVGVDTLSIFSSIQGHYQYIDLIHRSPKPDRGGDHGTMVLSVMAAIESGRFRGAIPDAEFVLFRTENTREETKAEEFQFLRACEIADSLGVDVLNISLGYTGFDDEEQSYSYQDMDGQTALSTWACNMAAQTGILVVTSAGNLGDKNWRYISAPGDSDSVITVGAIDYQRQVASFSSRGPTADGRTKPDVVAPGVGVLVYDRKGKLTTGYGTSFSAPLVTSLAAGLLQAQPQLKSWEIKELIIKSSSLYPHPNDSTGYGVPNFIEAYKILNPNSIEGEGEYFFLKNPLVRGERICFEKTPKKITINDLSGKTAQYSFDERCIVVKNDLTSGVYFFRVDYGLEQINFKILIE